MLSDFKNLVFADLHIHSKYSRATSKNLNLENLEKWAIIKGLDILGTGDFTHPKWLEELKANLQDKEKKGIFYTKNNFRFVLTGEISLIFTKGKGRRVHLVLLAPNFEVVDDINKYLDKKGRRDYDGRPIFNISCEEFVEEMVKISEKIEIIPGHAWTPWFGVFGSESGFNSLKEAFGSQYDYIHAIETGMSSDPEMNWRIKELNNKTIVSFSDAHSFWPWRMGREATIFNKISSYDDIIEEIRKNLIYGTIETDPAYGKYHFDGHRLCKFSSSPEETKKLNGICPVCKKPLTIGVENRIERLTNQNIEQHPNKKPYFKLLPLHEIIAMVYNIKISSKKSWKIYNDLIEKFGNEFRVLLQVKKEDFLREKFDIKLVEQILLNREGKIKVIPGYDGEYGKAVLNNIQKRLF
ncbi:MAG: endonuclease Q family protein [Candidatus Pacearchaeota archaeon]